MSDKYHIATTSLFSFIGLMYGLSISRTQSYKVIFLRAGVCTLMGSVFGNSVGDSIDPDSKPGSMLFDIIIPKVYKFIGY